jgi:hypothetical protein
LSRKGWLLFGALCLIWGIPYLLIRVAVRDFSPPTLVFLRTAPAALLLLPLAARKGHLHALLPRWRWVLSFAVVELAVPWLLIARAEQHISSSMTGLLLATVPLMGAVLYGFVPGMEQLDKRRLAAWPPTGVIALVGIDVGQTDLLAVGEVIAGAVLRDRPAHDHPAPRRLPPGDERRNDGRHRLRPGRPDAPPAKRVRRGDRLRVGLADRSPGLRRLFELILEVGPGADGHHLINPPSPCSRRGHPEQPFTLHRRLPPILAGSVLATRRSALRRSPRRWPATRRATTRAFRYRTSG